MATTRRRTARKKMRKKKKTSLWKKILYTFLTIFMLAFLSVFGVFLYFILTAPKLDVEKLDVAYSSQFYNKDGELFADIGEEKRIKVSYDELPEVLIDAVIATEDARFFDHPGIDLRRILGAIRANIKHGFGSEGASTITQQVVENMFLTPEKKLKLKVQEQWLALQLEREYSKEQILEMYLNKIFYGNNAYGVAKAAEVYFDIKDLNELNLVQAAILAGLPQRPSAYNPFENPDLMKERVDTVLSLMVRHGKITEEEAEEARKVDIESVLTDKKPKPLPYDAFVQEVTEEIKEKLPDVDVYTAGLKVYTTLDNDIQEHVEFLLTDSEENPINYPDEDLLAGMVVLDTKTGAIRAIGGSRNRDTLFGTNYATEAHRQPGSTIKPLLAYGPAIEYEKWSTYEQINDDKPYEKGGSNPIRNWNRQYQGWVSARYALAQSLNVPAVKTFEEIGADRAKEFAENLGIEFADEHLDVRDVIGGTKTNVSPLQLAGAFSAFGNEGIYTEPYAVTKVEFPDGSVIDLKPESEAVMADYTAYMITDMLKSVVTSGTGTNANIPHLPVAGKTGTTNVEGKEGANNSWFVGYTTNFSIAVWTGYKEYNRVIPDTQVPHRLFTNTMIEISKDIDTPDFKKPDSVVEVQIEKGSNPPKLPSENTPKENIITELFVKGTEPKGVSDVYDEVEPVTNLQATYNESANAIDISWGYDADRDVSFEVSYKVGDGSWKALTTTNDMQAQIENVEDNVTYTIQVVAIDEDSGAKSEPKSVSVQIGEEEPEEELGTIEGLQATYDENSNTVNVSWQYTGSGAQFEVDINGNVQTIGATNLQITDVSQGDSYLIKVTPIVDSERGQTAQTTITVPVSQEEPDDQDGSDDDQQGDNDEDDDQEDEDDDEED